MAEAQNDPLLPGYSFNAHLVAGLTPIEANGYLDFFIDRPLGMKGYILNLTIRGQGVVKNQGREFVCRPGDILLFPPGEIHHYGRHPEAREWYHQWVYFRPRAYWHEWLNWPSIFANTGFFRPDEAHRPQFCLSNCYCGAWKRLTSRSIHRWIIGYARLVSTSAITWQTAILISPASHSMFACHRRVCHIFSASS